MISAIDHVVIAVHDIEEGARRYQTLFGSEPGPAQTRDGVTTTLFSAGNVAVELMAPSGAGGERLRAALDEGGEGLKSLVFAVESIEDAHRRAERVGLAPEAIVENSVGWRSFRAATNHTHGVRIFFIQCTQPLTPIVGARVSGLDHVVVRSGNIERAAALYGARLGLDMRLDREIGGRRLMFFRCGGAVVEIVEDSALDGRDALWGLSWRVASAAEARSRLAAAGLNVSEVRAGMKPGTQVFTVRDGTCGVPTLFVEAGPRPD